MRNRRTLAICDVCGFEYKLHQLKKQVVARKTTSVLACRSCLDKDQPQWFGPRTMGPDPKPIPNARPDIMESEIFSGYGWSPVGGLGVWMMTGASYDFDLRDTLVSATPTSFLLQEDGFLLIQEDGGVMELES